MVFNLWPYIYYILTFGSFLISCYPAKISRVQIIQNPYVEDIIHLFLVTLFIKSPSSVNICWPCVQLKDLSALTDAS